MVNCAAALAGLVVGCQGHSFLELGLRVGFVVQRGVGHAEMRCILGRISRGVLKVGSEQVTRSSVVLLVVVDPCERVSGLWSVRQDAGGGLRQGQRDIDVAAVLNREVSEVVGGDGVVGIDLDGPSGSHP